MNDAQEQLLGCMILNFEAATNAYTNINADYFSGRNRLVYETIERILQRGQKPTQRVVSEYLPRVSEDDSFGRVFENNSESDSYISSLVSNCCNSNDYASALELVRLQYARQLLTEAGYEFINIAKSNYDISKMSDKARLALSQALTGVDNNNLEHDAKDCLDDFVERKKNASSLTRVPYFFNKYNKQTGGGMLPGQIITLGARTNIGKSMIACQQLESGCTSGLSGEYYTMEMTQHEITERLVAIGGISEERMESPDFDVSSITKRIEQVRSWDFTIYEGSTSISRIRTNLIKKIAVGKKPDFIIIDHAHLLDVGSGEAYRIGLNKAMTELKEICNVYQVACLLLAQLRKPSLEAENHPPMMSDIRESNAIEQISDVVFLMHRGRNSEGELQPSGSMYNPKKRKGKQFPTVGFCFMNDKCKFVETT